MLKNCVLILPVSDPAKQAAQVVKHHVFDERTDYLAGGDTRGPRVVLPNTAYLFIYIFFVTYII
jgi:hypothetical protein